MPRASTATTAPDHPPPLAISLLGGFTVASGGHAIPERIWGGSRKARALLKLLALAPGQRLHRDQALDALWPDLDPEDAGRALYQALYLLRRALAPAGAQVPLQAQVVTLHAPGGLTIDLATFTAAAAVARSTRTPAAYEAALAQYHGELLPDDRYEEWALQPREAARTAHLGLLRDLAAVQEAGDDPAGAVAALDRLVATEPTDEAAHVALMRLHAQGGRRARALQQFGQLRAALQREIDAEPEAASQQLYAAILAGHYPASDSRTPESRSAPSATPHNLPAPTTALIGRDAALAAIQAELAAARLVTLVGTGGIGKTRLALAVGRALLDAHPGGVWLLDLAALQDGALLDGTLARVLDVRERPDQPLRAALVAALRGRPALLILDNCEHLVDACADLAAAFLAGCPDLRVLATSRESLRVAGELRWRVPSLPVPAPPTDTGGATPLGDLAANPAVGLFLERARFARPGFALTADNATALAAICRRLDGIPLALELAAARVAVLAPPQLAARLDDALRLLTGGPRTALPRHQTLRATLGWSYRFLATAERMLLDRLAVFAGSCTLAAAEAVDGGPWTGDGGPSTDTLDRLAALVDKSLVQVEAGSDGAAEPRYRLLETVRQFAVERLVAGGDEATYRARHVAHFLHLAEAAEAGLLGEQQALWIARLARDLDNLRAALAWCAAHDQASGLRLASALERFWLAGNYYHEGLAWLTDGLAQTGDSVAPSIRARAYLAAALLTITRADAVQAETFAMAGLVLYRALGDRDQQAEACNTLGIAARYRREPERSRAYLEEALALWRAVGNARGIARASLNLAAEYVDRDEMAAAAAVYAEILPLIRTLNDRRLLYLMLVNLGLGYAGSGRIAETRAPLAESIRLMAVARDWMLLSFCLIVVALVANGADEPVRAAQFLGAGVKLRTVTNLAPIPTQQRFADRAAGVASASLGAAAYAAAHATGFAWSVEEIIAQALAYLTTSAEC